MSKQPQAYINFDVYENAVDLVGVAKVTLPDISYLTATLNGPGIAGNIEAVLIGMVEAMTTTLNFTSVTAAATKLLRPEKHQLDLRVAEQDWDPVSTERAVAADKYVMVVVPKSTKPGTIAPASTADTSGEYAVYRYEAYKNGKTLWKIDPYNYICEIDGVDYMAEVRKALGK